MRRGRVARGRAAVRAAGRGRGRGARGARGVFLASEPRAWWRVPGGSGNAGAAVDGRARSAGRGGGPAGSSRPSPSPSRVAVTAAAATAATRTYPRRRPRRRGGAAGTLGVAHQSGGAPISSASRSASAFRLGSRALSGARNGLGGSLAGARAGTDSAGSVIALPVKRGERRIWPPSAHVWWFELQASCSATASPRRLTERRVGRLSASSA